MTSYLRRLLQGYLVYRAARHVATRARWAPGAHYTLVGAAMGGSWEPPTDYQDDAPLYGGTPRTADGRHAAQTLADLRTESAADGEPIHRVQREFRHLIAGQARACEQTAARLRRWADEDPFPERATVWRHKAARIERRARDYQHVLLSLDQGQDDGDWADGWYAIGSNGLPLPLPPLA